MATNYLTLKGTVKWAKIYDPDVFAGAENWKINFYPDNDSEWEKYNKAQLQLVVKEDIDGRYITFRRPTKKLIKDDLVIFSPPEITGKVQISYTDEEGNKVRQYNKGDKIKVSRQGDPVLIGNGSLCLVNFSYYTTQKGAGHRLEGINVLDLVEVGQQTLSDKPVEVIEEVKAEDSKEKKKVKNDTTVSEDLNDALPW